MHFVAAVPASIWCWWSSSANASVETIASIDNSHRTNAAWTFIWRTTSRIKRCNTDRHQRKSCRNNNTTVNRRVYASRRSHSTEVSRGAS
jgi:hypothetical protein